MKEDTRTGTLIHRNHFSKLSSCPCSSSAAPRQPASPWLACAPSPFPPTPESSAGHAWRTFPRVPRGEGSSFSFPQFHLPSPVNGTSRHGDDTSVFRALPSGSASCVVHGLSDEGRMIIVLCRG
ncbi:hypothetical protein HJG60_012151 [Phyllostomus discolor]|uniref:Uncharacterized protein n=1 Tax=Phyllostomus discolor TaxID=89673 RepID=A0A833ZJV8_9CHIR|nr:hypothetical protein HJG60_012151 [Phyllostomus discolor]